MANNFSDSQMASKHSDCRGKLVILCSKYLMSVLKMKRWKNVVEKQIRMRPKTPSSCGVTRCGAAAEPAQQCQLTGTAQPVLWASLTEQCYGRTTHMLFQILTLETSSLLPFFTEKMFGLQSSKQRPKRWFQRCCPLTGQGTWKAQHEAFLLVWEVRRGEIGSWHCGTEFKKK